MDHVLVAGGSHSEIPLIDALHNMGYYVITTGNNPDGLGHKAADKYEPGDFSDPDWVLSLAKKHSVKGIVAGCNDFSYLSVAYACEKLGIPGHDTYETARTIHHKEQFRSLLKKCDLPAPKHLCVSDAKELPAAIAELGFPLLIKPVDLTGGKGVNICNNEDDMRIAFAAAMQSTREDFVIAEQMIIGENHGASALISRGKVVFVFFDNEEYYLNKYLVSGANSPAKLTDSVKQNIIRQFESVAKNAHLTDGLFHSQCIVNGENAYMIDPCRRAPGDLYIKLVEYSAGISYPEAIVRAELGLPFENLVPSPDNAYSCIARECIMTDGNGIYENYAINPELEKFVMDRLVWAKRGEPITDYLKYKAGIVFFKFPDQITMQTQLERIHENMTIPRTKAVVENGIE